MRYDSQERLDLWARTGRFPSIHDTLAAFVAARVREPRGFLDLCCSTGLLGQRIKSMFPDAAVVGVDADAGAIGRGTCAGVSVPLVLAQIEPGTFQRLGAIMREHGVTVVVARRCLSELFANAPGCGDALSSALQAYGAREMFVEGRMRMARASHPYPHIDAELAELNATGSWKLVARHRECAYLSAKG